MSKLSVTKVHGAGRTAALRSWITMVLLLTTYETTGYFKVDDIEVRTSVVDEALYQNPEARRTVNVRNISSHASAPIHDRYRVRNKVDEMIALIKMLQPRIAAQIQGMVFMSAAPQFREKRSHLCITDANV